MTPPTAPRNGWSEYEKLVLWRLDALDERMGHVEATGRRTENKVTELKVRAGLWGILAGSIPGLVAALVFWLKS
jgi:hypothetical protein